MPTTVITPTMRRLLKFLPLVLLFINPLSLSAQFQQGQLQFSQQFRLGETIIRVAEVGQLADTVHVWGDVNVGGAYVVPRGTSLASIVSYSRGPSRYFTGESTLDWSKLRIEVTVSSDDSSRSRTFTFRYNEPLPSSITSLRLQNNDVVMVELKRKPSVLDWLRVVAPVVSTVATTILIVQNLR